MSEIVPTKIVLTFPGICIFCHQLYNSAEEWCVAHPELLDEVEAENEAEATP